MSNCSQCGVDILFGGVKEGNLRFCGRRCRDLYAEWLANLQAAERYYRYALGKLRANPTDPEVKQKALDGGRVYSAWTRRGRSATLFDEVALANDITAACAAAAGPSASGTTSLSPEARLERLQGLRQKGLISDIEYETKRNEILAEL